MSQPVMDTTVLEPLNPARHRDPWADYEPSVISVDSSAATHMVPAIDTAATLAPPAPEPADHPDTYPPQGRRPNNSVVICEVPRPTWLEGGQVPGAGKFSGYKFLVRNLYCRDLGQAYEWVDRDVARGLMDWPADLSGTWYSNAGAAQLFFTYKTVGSACAAFMRCHQWWSLNPTADAEGTRGWTTANVRWMDAMPRQIPKAYLRRHAREPFEHMLSVPEDRETTPSEIYSEHYSASAVGPTTPMPTRPVPEMPAPLPVQELNPATSTPAQPSASARAPVHADSVIPEEQEGAAVAAPRMTAEAVAQASASAPEPKAPMGIGYRGGIPGFAATATSAPSVP